MIAQMIPKLAPSYPQISAPNYPQPRIILKSVTKSIPKLIQNPEISQKLGLKLSSNYPQTRPELSQNNLKQIPEIFLNHRSNPQINPKLLHN